jgi:hypothetical protein
MIDRDQKPEEKLVSNQQPAILQALSEPKESILGIGSGAVSHPQNYLCLALLVSCLLSSRNMGLAVPTRMNIRPGSLYAISAGPSGSPMPKNALARCASMPSDRGLSRNPLVKICDLVRASHNVLNASWASPSSRSAIANRLIRVFSRSFFSIECISTTYSPATPTNTKKAADSAILSDGVNVANQSKNATSFIVKTQASICVVLLHQTAPLPANSRERLLNTRFQRLSRVN